MPLLLSNPVTIHHIYLYLGGKHLTNDEMTAVQEHGVASELCEWLPENLTELDRNHFEFSCDTREPDGKRWAWTHLPKHGHAPGFATLKDAAVNAYWHHVDLYQDIHRLSKDGFSVVPFGDPETFYWRYVKGNRVSPLFPTEEGAWRDCKRDDEEVRRKIHAHFSSPAEYPTSRQKVQPFKDAVRNHALVFETITALEPMLEEAGFEITDKYWKMRGENHRTMVPEGRVKVIRSALLAWSMANPAQFTASIEALDRVSEPAAFGTGHLEALLREARYQITEGGWNHPDVEQIRLIQGGRDQVVLDAWRHYQGVCGVTFTDPVWKGAGLPPLNAAVWVAPHNTSWGFTRIDKVKAKVLGYHDEYVWLRLTQKVGMVSEVFVTTRTDKVTFEPCGSEQDGQ